MPTQVGNWLWLQFVLCVCVCVFANKNVYYLIVFTALRSLSTHCFIVCYLHAFHALYFILFIVCIYTESLLMIRSLLFYFLFIYEPIVIYTYIYFVRLATLDFNCRLYFTQIISYTEIVDML